MTKISKSIFLSAFSLRPKFVLKRSLRQVYGDTSKITSKTEQTYWHLLLRKGNRKGFSEVLGSTILHGKDNKPNIQRVSMPTLIMWGEKDCLIPVEDAAIFESLIPDSKTIIYKGVGHIPMEEIPRQSAEDAKSFLLEA